MSAISEYIKNLEKCSNINCNLKMSCARYNVCTTKKFNHINCINYFKLNSSRTDDVLNNLKSIFGMK
jgi:hypothetical protein